MKTIVFFNNKGGVGKTTTVYHLAWMLSEMGIKTIAADIDPQSNLTSMFLAPDRLEEIYESQLPLTILDAVNPVLQGDQYQPVHIEPITEYLGLIPGNLSLSASEDKLGDAWLKCLNSDVFAFKVTSVFNTILNEAAKRFEAAVVLVDVGPNLGAINRAVVISADYIIMPVASDLFSLQGIRNLGLTLKKWEGQWKQRKEHLPTGSLNIEIPEKQALPCGYIVMQYSAARGNRPVKSYLKWANRIPGVFAEAILHKGSNENSIEEDEYCLALLKHYRSLAPMSMEAHKPIFLLKPADGAIGAHFNAVQKSFEEFKSLATRMLEVCK